MKVGRVHGTILLFVALLLSAGSAMAQQLWYQHYEQALKFEQQGKWRAALEEANQAARRRPEPEARVRTYGSRFLFNYDPAYHQALCLVALKRWEEARKFLSASRSAGVTKPDLLDALRRRIEAAPAKIEPEPAKTASVTPVAAALSQLQVDSTPTDALVMVDGRVVGRTPITGLDVAVGPHQVEVEVEGFDGWSQEVEAQEGKSLHLLVALNRAPTGGELSTRTNLAKGEDKPRVSSTIEAIPPPELSQPEERIVAQERGSQPQAREPARVEEVSPATPPKRESEPAEIPPPGATQEGALPADTDAEPEVVAEPPTNPPTNEMDTPTASVPNRQESARSSWAWWPLALGLGSVLVVGLLVWGRWRQAEDSGTVSTVPSLTNSGLLSNTVDATLGGYRLLEVLGRGGMATTYLAERLADGREVALKVPHESGDPLFRSRFVREGRLGQALHHPRLVRIFEAGEEAGRAFLAMERIPGRTLRAEIDQRSERMSVRRVLEIVGDIAEGLDYAHTKGVVHRDLKPANIMLKPDGSLKVMDFGIARFDDQPGLTAAGYFFGSPLYAAPEQAKEGETDHRADLYSLGVIFFELLEGKPPFVSESVFRVLEMHRDDTLPDPSSLPAPPPPEVWKIVVKLLAKDPKDRFATAQELLVELKRLLFQMEDPGAVVGNSHRTTGGAASAADTVAHSS